MPRKILTTLAATIAVWAMLALGTLVLPGCGDGVRDVPEGTNTVPTAEEKAELKADPSSK